MIKFYNLESIKSSKDNLKKAPSGFRYGFISNIFKDDVYEKLVASYPDVKKFKLVDKPSGGGRKRFYVGPNYITGKDGGCFCRIEGLPQIWKDVLEESASSELITAISAATDIDFNSLGIFGFAYGNEGCMQESHIDGAVRDNPTFIKSPIACLLYINKDSEGSSGTRIYAADGKTELFKAPSMRNGLFFFEQHIDAWHGFPVVPPGEERRLVSIAYNREESPIYPKRSLAHKITCLPGHKYRLKNLLGRAV